MIPKVVKEEQRAAYLLVQKSKPILKSGQSMQSKSCCEYMHILKVQFY